jgi:zinc finger SWIM domain-containing protein 3
MFAVGDKFFSYKAVEEKIKLFEESNYVQVWKREARTIKGAQKSVVRYLNPELQSYQLKYCCVHGGKDFKSVAKGDRSSSTFKKHCPMHITLRVNSEGNQLDVISVDLEHNHEISRALYKHLPKQR